MVKETRLLQRWAWPLELVTVTRISRFGNRVFSGVCTVCLPMGLLATLAPLSFAAAPAHDMFSAAKGLTDPFGTDRGTTADATKEDGEPAHAGILGNKSVWYRWTAPESGLVVFDTLSRRSTFDTVLAAYTGDRLADLVPVAGNDDVARFSRLSRMTVEARAGDTYMVALDGVAGKNGSYRLHWAMRPRNDDFRAAQRIARRSGTAIADNSLATRQDLEARRGSHSIWYMWTAPATRRLQFDTQGSGFDTVLTVYRGTRLGQLRIMAANDDARGLGLRSRVQFTAQAGRTYRLAVTSFSRRDTGRAVLNWQRP